MYLNTVFKYNVFKYCPALSMRYTFMLIKTYLRLHCCAPYVRTIASSTRVFINNIRAQVRRKSIFIVKKLCNCKRILKA